MSTRDDSKTMHSSELSMLLLGTGNGGSSANADMMNVLPTTEMEKSSKGNHINNNNPNSSSTNKRKRNVGDAMNQVDVSQFNAAQASQLLKQTHGVGKRSKNKVGVGPGRISEADAMNEVGSTRHRRRNIKRNYHQLFHEIDNTVSQQTTAAASTTTNVREKDAGISSYGVHDRGGGGDDHAVDFDDTIARARSRSRLQHEKKRQSRAGNQTCSSSDDDSDGSSNSDDDRKSKRKSIRRRTRDRQERGHARTRRRGRGQRQSASSSSSSSSSSDDDSVAHRRRRRARVARTRTVSSKNHHGDPPSRDDISMKKNREQEIKKETSQDDSSSSDDSNGGGIVRSRNDDRNLKDTNASKEEGEGSYSNDSIRGTAPTRSRRQNHRKDETSDSSSSSSDSSSTSSDSDSEDSLDDTPTHVSSDKPLFVPKHKRAKKSTTEDQHQQQLQQESLQQMKIDKRIRQSRALVAEAVSNSNTNTNSQQSVETIGDQNEFTESGGSIAPPPDDRDHAQNYCDDKADSSGSGGNNLQEEVYQMKERENWEVRELLRLLRDFEIFIQKVKDAKEMDRRKQMTDEERLREDVKTGRYRKPGEGARNEIRNKILAKNSSRSDDNSNKIASAKASAVPHKKLPYYHKGAFYLDDE